MMGWEMNADNTAASSSWGGGNTDTAEASWQNGAYGAAATTGAANSVAAAAPHKDSGYDDSQIRCRNCKEDGHFTRDCPEPQKEQLDISSMKCYNCDGIGHGSRSCPEPQREREVKPLLDWSHHPEMDSEEAWAKLKAVDAERDMDDIKEAFEVYAKNSPDVNFRTIEERSRAEKLNLHLVALEKVLPLNKTNVDLQGVADRRYAIGFQLSAKSRRLAMTATMLAASPEENLERLEECGYTVHSRVPVCFNCNQKGHIGKNCPEPTEDRTLSHIVKIVCSNCEQEGHRLRNCPEPRKIRSNGCRNCGSEEHIAADCDQPRKPREGESCHNCGSEDHYGRDCTELRKEREDTRPCHNCDGVGHLGKDCSEPRKDTRACHNCNRVGHLSRDCTEPRRARREQDMYGGPGNNINGDAGGYNAFTEPAAAQEPSWESSAANSVPAWGTNKMDACSSQAIGW